MLIEARDIEKSFAGGASPVLRGVSLALAPGETVALTGESGSGKSTFLHIVAGLETADAGALRVCGADPAALSDAGRAALRRERLGIVFQQFNLVPSLTAEANVAFQARLAGRHDPARVAALLGRLGLADAARKYPEELSGGQQQRVAVARALAAGPALILADEPTGNLDEATGDAVLEAMLALVREAGAGLLMVTHSERLAARLDRRLHLRHGRFSP